MKRKYEICQRTFDGKWEIIALCHSYKHASEIVDALEWSGGKKYAVFENGMRIRN